VWVNAGCFDIADRVHIRALPATANDAGLLQACEELRQPPLDWSPPLWELRRRKMPIANEKRLVFC
jgi:hypothetical protein